MSTTSTRPSSTPLPASFLDPRFKAARALVMNGRAEDAIEILAALLDQTVTAKGNNHLEAAPLYHEYGNALFRAYRRNLEREDEEDAENDSTKQDPEALRSAAAAAAEKRLEAASPVKTTSQDARNEPVKNDSENASDSDSESDLALALEMLEEGWAIYDAAKDSADNELGDFIREQMPRILSHLGEVLLECKRYADALDVHLQALQCHDDLLQALLKESPSEPTMDILKYRRKVTEDNIFLAETLLACPSDDALVTTETRVTLVPAGERLPYAKGYYDAAKSQLQEAVLVMGELAAKNVDLGEEKENVCFASTLVMAVGVTLNELEEELAKSAEPSTKKAKTT